MIVYLCACLRGAAPAVVLTKQRVGREGEAPALLPRAPGRLTSQSVTKSLACSLLLSPEIGG